MRAYLLFIILFMCDIIVRVFLIRTIKAEGHKNIEYHSAIDIDISNFKFQTSMNCISIKYVFVYR